MFNAEQCRSIARDECVKIFGESFVQEHKSDFSYATCIDEQSGLFEYSLLYAEPEESNGSITIGDTPFDYYASVIVNMSNGRVCKDPDERKTKLPAGLNTP